MGAIGRALAHQTRDPAARAFRRVVAAEFGASFWDKASKLVRIHEKLGSDEFRNFWNLNLKEGTLDRLSARKTPAHVRLDVRDAIEAGELVAGSTIDAQIAQMIEQAIGLPAPSAKAEELARKAADRDADQYQARAAFVGLLKRYLPESAYKRAVKFHDRGGSKAEIQQALRAGPQLIGIGLTNGELIDLRTGGRVETPTLPSQSRARVMLGTELYDRLTPFRLLSLKNALLPRYDSIVLTANLARGAAPKGWMEVEIELDGLGDPELFVDTFWLLDLLRDLPAEEFHLHAVGTGFIWSCGRSHGQFPNDDIDYAPNIDWPANDPEFEVGEGFAKGLKLGALACKSMAMNTLNLYGVLLDNAETGLRAYSCDDRTLSSASLCARIPDSPATATLEPDTIPLLITVSAKRYAKISFDDRHLYCTG